MIMATVSSTTTLKCWRKYNTHIQVLLAAVIISDRLFRRNYHILQ